MTKKKPRPADWNAKRCLDWLIGARMKRTRKPKRKALSNAASKPKEMRLAQAAAFARFVHCPHASVDDSTGSGGHIALLRSVHFPLGNERRFLTLRAASVARLVVM